MKGLGVLPVQLELGGTRLYERRVGVGYLDLAPVGRLGPDRFCETAAGHSISLEVGFSEGVAKSVNR
jgi:hypothetical protein